MTLHPSALPFVDAVAEQLARREELRPPALSPGEWHARTRNEVERMLGLVLRSGGGDSAHALAASPVLLAAFFQNVDLLFLHDHPGAAEIGSAVLNAVELLEE